MESGMIEMTLNIPELEARQALERATFESLGFDRRREVVRIFHQEFEQAFRAGGYSLSGRANAWTENTKEWTERKRAEGRSTRKLVYRGDLFKAAVRASIRAVANKLIAEWESKSKDGFDVATHWQNDDKKTFRKLVPHPELVRRLNDEFYQAIEEELGKYGYEIGEAA